MKGAGYKGIGLLSPSMSAAPLGTPPWDFDPNLATLTPRMAKRGAMTVFAAAPIVQGKRDGTGVTDTLYLHHGTLIGSFFNPNFDENQGSITFRIIPEWNGNDNLRHGIYTNDFITINKQTTNYIIAEIGTRNISVDVSGWIAGTAYNICIRWDTKNTLDGTNYMCITINDTHTFGGLSFPIELVLTGNAYIGSEVGIRPCNAIIEGLTIYRRVLWDGTYGVNVGNGDEVALIAAGVDPCTITGSWDVVVCVPTNATTGQIVTGTGEAWSHPHGSNALTRGFLSDRYYGGGQWGVKFNGTTSYIDCGSGASLDDIPTGGVLQVEGWFNCSGALYHMIVAKGNYQGGVTPAGWGVMVYGGALDAFVKLGTTNILCTSGGGSVNDGKWHHFCFSYDDTTKRARLALDGIWPAGDTIGAGAYVSDASLTLRIGRSSTSTEYYYQGSIGWINIHNDAHYTVGTNFVPPRAFPGADVEGWLLNEGTGAV